MRNQIGNQLITNMLKLICQPALKIQIVIEDMGAFNICGLIINSMNLVKDAGALRFAEIVDLGRCLMEDLFNSSVMLIRKRIWHH